MDNSLKCEVFFFKVALFDDFILKMATQISTWNGAVNVHHWRVQWYLIIQCSNWRYPQDGAQSRSFRDTAIRTHPKMRSQRVSAPVAVGRCFNNNGRLIALQGNIYTYTIYIHIHKWIMTAGLSIAELLLIKRSVTCTKRTKSAKNAKITIPFTIWHFPQWPCCRR